MKSRSYQVYSSVVALVFACLPGSAQTTASCTFTTFNPPGGGYSWPSPTGINNYGTQVGAVLSPPINTVLRWRGLVRYSGGAMTTYNYPGAQYT